MSEEKLRFRVTKELGERAFLESGVRVEAACYLEKLAKKGKTCGCLTGALAAYYYGNTPAYYKKFQRSGGTSDVIYDDLEKIFGSRNYISGLDNGFTDYTQDDGFIVDRLSGCPAEYDKGYRDGRAVHIKMLKDHADLFAKGHD